MHEIVKIMLDTHTTRMQDHHSRTQMICTILLDLHPVALCIIASLSLNFLQCFITHLYNCLLYGTGKPLSLAFVTILFYVMSRLLKPTYLCSGVLVKCIQGWRTTKPNRKHSHNIASQNTEENQCFGVNK